MSKAPSAMTMDRLGDTKQIILAQSTSQCCRMGMCQPSINWVVREADKWVYHIIFICLSIIWYVYIRMHSCSHLLFLSSSYDGGNPHALVQQAWIHEESTFLSECIILYICLPIIWYVYIYIVCTHVLIFCFYHLVRCLSGCLPGCRAVKYVQHSSTVPASVVKSEDYKWCTCQCDETPEALSEEDRNKDVIATHEKGQTCTGGICCCYLPYLETKDSSSGKLIGKTQYVCDGWSEYITLCADLL